MRKRKSFLPMGRYSAEEQKALSEGVSLDVVDQNRIAREKLENDPDLAQRHSEKRKKNLRRDEKKDWSTDRGFPQYNALFRYALGRDLMHELVGLWRGKDGPMKIFEDGAGDGIFLDDIKTKLLEFGIKVQTTALVLRAQPDLVDRQRRGVVDKIIQKPAEEFIPREKQDVIIQLYGSLTHGTPELKRETVLREAYSLNVGGLGLFGFGVLPSKESTKKVQANIVSSFRKRGFEASFRDCRKVQSFNDLPETVLIVRRIK